MVVRAPALSLGLLAAGLLACSADEPPAPPAPTTAAAASVSELRYCLSPALGDATATVAQLVAELSSDALALVHVEDLDATCDFRLDGIDFVVAPWDATACRHTDDELACSVRSLLVDLDGLGSSTSESADPETLDDLRDQLALMVEVGLGGKGAPAIAPPPPPPPADPTLTGCGFASIGPVVPSPPNSYQLTSFSATYLVDPACSITFEWSSSVIGPFGGSFPSASVQLPAGTHTITFTVTAACSSDPSDPDAPVIEYVCEDELELEVEQGRLTGGPFCDRDNAWWDAQAAAGLVHIQDERTSAVGTLTGTNGPDLLLGNDRPNKINGRRSGDCLYGFGERDDLVGHAGADTISGGDAGDRIHGHDDQDRVWGEGGGDRVRGGSGGDYLAGGDGDDDLDGNWDRDTIFGNAGDDRLLGGWDDDTLYGGAGDDCVRGDSGADWLYGDDDDDIVAGELGNDRLWGGAGDDQMDGGWDDDDLHGGDGDDDLQGDLGADELFGDGDDDRLCGGLGADDKDGGTGTNVCQMGGNNTNCQSTPLSCPLPAFPSC